MKSKRKTLGRIELGQVSTATLGNEFRTIEQVGLQGTYSGITDR
jgi:hypothetical protein